jgi:hypothetical protein
MNTLTTRAERPCVSCKWVRRSRFIICVHPETFKADPVIGTVQWNCDAKELRMLIHRCGPDGAWYEPCLTARLAAFLRRALPV